VRESIPIDMILRAYLDETTEDDVVEEIKETPVIEDQQVGGGISSAPISDSLPKSSEQESSKLSFNNVDMAIDTNNKEETIVAPKDIARLEEISNMRNEQRKLESDDDDDNDSGIKLKISGDDISLGNMDVHNLEPQSIEIIPDLLIDDIEVLV
jgi:hypothetical protein